MGQLTTVLLVVALQGCGSTYVASSSELAGDGAVDGEERQSVNGMATDKRVMSRKDFRRLSA